MPPARNVELKATDPDPAATLAAARAAGAEDRGVLHQRDTYFPSAAGRLKLREQDGAGELIAYERADDPRVRTSTYHRASLADPAATREALDAAFGTVVDVVKARRLLIHGTIRIHLDEVEGLGSFVELEAVAADGSDLSAEHAAVALLREQLGIGDDRIVAAGYAQLLLAAGARDALVDAARRAMASAYVPYSHFPVGAALLDEAGRVHSGPNVENAAYPQGQCAEASAIGALVRGGGTAIREVAVMADTELITPCGGCRQRLAEFGAPEVPVHLCGPEGVRRTVTLGELLPLSFSQTDLHQAPEAVA